MIPLWLACCEPGPATDRERGRKEMREVLARNAKRGEHERIVREINREFVSRFEGEVQAGVGCQACPDMCKRTDLRQIPIHELHRMYRAAAMQRGYPADDRMLHLAWLELERLGCIARDGGPAMQEAWLSLLDAGEDSAVRYAAAVQAVEHRLAPEAGLHVLAEIAAGTSKFAVAADIRLEEWKIGITPSL